MHIDRERTSNLNVSYFFLSFSLTFTFYHHLLPQADVQQTLDSLDKDKGNEAILGSFARLRLIAALAKVDAAVALAKNTLQEESSLVIFTMFVKVAKEVHKKLNDSHWEGELLCGETPPKDRQPKVDRFQVGNVCALFIAFARHL